MTGVQTCALPIYNHTTEAGYPRPTADGKEGIDLFYTIMTHELQHASDFWYKVKHPFATDTDGDGLPDDIDPFPNTVNGAGYPEYTDPNQGDVEYRARQVEDVTASPNIDWANTGKQANGINNPIETSSFQDILSVSSLGFSKQLGLAKVNFTGNVSDYRVDIDSDSFYDYLIIEVELNTTFAGNLTVTGELSGENYTLWAVNHSYLDVGIQSIMLKFDGIAIRQHRNNGPYLISLLLQGSQTYEYNTSAYAFTEFQRMLSEFTTNYSDYGIDTDGDGLYDYLAVDVGINVTLAGNYTIEGWLYDSNETHIVWADNQTYLDAGTQSVALNFDGLTIYQHRTDGPYNLKYLRLYDGNGSQIDFILNAYNTSVYTSTEFQKLSAGLGGNYSDFTTDPDVNGDRKSVV